MCHLCKKEDSFQFKCLVCFYNYRRLRVPIDQLSIVRVCEDGNICMNVKALFALSYGLYIVTSIKGDERNGQIVNTVFQVAAEPLKIVASICKDNLTHAHISDSGVLAVSVLAVDAPMRLIGTFGFKSGRDVDKFATVSFKIGTTGCPLVLDHTLAFLEAKVTDTLDVGSHTLFVGQAVAADVLKEGKPMTYDYYHAVKGGKTPKNAATYVREPVSAEHTGEKSDNGGASTSAARHICSICGYVYDPGAGDPDGGVSAGTSFEKLPRDWVCPVCGASRDEFDKE